MFPCANAVESSRARRGRKENVQGERIFWKRLREIGVQRCKATEAHSLSRELLLADSPRGSSRLEPRRSHRAAGNA